MNEADSVAWTREARGLEPRAWSLELEAWSLHSTDLVSVAASPVGLSSVLLSCNPDIPAAIFIIVMVSACDDGQVCCSCSRS